MLLQLQIIGRENITKMVERQVPRLSNPIFQADPNSRESEFPPTRDVFSVGAISESRLLQKEMSCRSDLRIATFARKLRINTLLGIDLS